MQNSGPWDPWLPVLKNSRLFSQRAHSAQCAPLYLVCKYLILFISLHKTFDTKGRTASHYHHLTYSYHTPCTRRWMPGVGCLVKEELIGASV